MSATVVGRAPAQHNCEHPLILEHDGSGRRWTQRCKATSEARCKPCADTYRRRVRLVGESGREMFPGDTVLFLTLTAPSEKGPHCRRHRGCDGQRSDECRVCECTPSEGVVLAEWNSECSSRWNRLIEQLRRESRMQLQYFRAAEVQDRGALHFHVLIRVPKGRTLKLTQASLRRLAIRYGFGHSVDLQVVNDEGRSWYLAKYASKSCTDREQMPWLDRRTGELTDGHGRYRCWTASRHWGWTMKSIRESQAAWWQDAAGRQPAEPAEAGPLDSNSQRYASATSTTLFGGCV